MNLSYETNFIAPKCSTGPCHMDLSAPLAVFCALLFAAVAICGTLDARAPMIVDDLKVLNQENVIGPVEMDLIASCRKNARGAHPSTADSQRCHDAKIVDASFSH